MIVDNRSSFPKVQLSSTCDEFIVELMTVALVTFEKRRELFATTDKVRTELRLIVEFSNIELLIPELRIKDERVPDEFSDEPVTPESVIEEFRSMLELNVEFIKPLALTTVELSMVLFREIEDVIVEFVIFEPIMTAERFMIDRLIFEVVTVEFMMILEFTNERIMLDKFTNVTLSTVLLMTATWNNVLFTTPPLEIED